MPYDALDIDAVTACVDLVGRSGGRQFEVGWVRDEDDPDYAERGPGWYASVLYRGAKLIEDERRTPDEAADALARRILGGGRCTHCGRTITLSGDDGCRWSRHGDTWLRGCSEGTGSGAPIAANRAERRRRERQRGAT